MFSSTSYFMTISRDIVAALLCHTLCRSVIALFTHKTTLFDALLVRKIYHISIGLVVMLCWPFFSSGYFGATSAGLVPGSVILAHFVRRRKSTEQWLRKAGDRYQGYRALVNASVGYCISIFLVTVLYWRSTIAIATISNLCAGDGVADIVGRRLGSLKLPYNKNKSYAGSIAMIVAGFLTSILFMHYFAWLGYISITDTHIVKGFVVVSIASALVESYPLGMRFDDNWTVPFAALIISNFIL